MRYTTLISAAGLRTILHGQDVCVVDCRFNLADTAAGKRAYLEGHIPGAVYAHLDDDLAGVKTGRNGRHPLPDREALSARLRAWGVNNTTQLVAYDAQGGAMAARFWWLLRWLGHEAVAVLDGGLNAWQAAGGQLDSDEPARPTGDFAPRTPLVEVVTAAHIEAALGTNTIRLLDARDPGRYKGEQEPLDPVAGHVPGAVNHFFMQNLDEQGRFKPVEQLRSGFEQTLAQCGGDTVHMCGSGVTACHNLLAMQHAGLEAGSLYVGSWSEWCSDPSRPVETGEGSR